MVGSKSHACFITLELRVSDSQSCTSADSTFHGSYVPIQSEYSARRRGPSGQTAAADGLARMLFQRLVS